MQPKEFIRATKRVGGFLNSLHNAVHSVAHHSDPDDLHVLHQALVTNDLLDLINEEAEGEFENYKDLCEFLFLQVYMQFLAIGNLTRTSVCEMIDTQLANLEEHIGRMN